MDTQALELEVAVPEMLPGLNLDPAWVAAALARASARELDEVADSRLQLRRGPLLLDASSANAGREYRVGVAGLHLDELEAGSLRGTLSAASLEANMEARQGEARAAVHSFAARRTWSGWLAAAPRGAVAVPARQVRQRGRARGKRLRVWERRAAW